MERDYLGAEVNRLLWSALAARSGDGALVWSSAFRRRQVPDAETRLKAELQTVQSGVSQCIGIGTALQILAICGSSKRCGHQCP